MMSLATVPPLCTAGPMSPLLKATSPQRSTWVVLHLNSLMLLLTHLLPLFQAQLVERYRGIRQKGSATIRFFR